MDIQNKSEQEAEEEFSVSSGNYVFTWTSRTKVKRSQGEEFSASSGNYVFTWTSRTKVNRRQRRSSLLAQVTM